MLFSRVSIEFGAEPTLPSILLDDDEAGDIGLQDLSTDEINGVGYFPLVSDSPLPGAFSSTITSLCTQEAQKVPPLPTPSPPERVTELATDNLASPATNIASESYVPSSLALNGLCISGVTTSSNFPAAVPEAPRARCPISNLDASISYEELASPWVPPEEEMGSSDHPHSLLLNYPHPFSDDGEIPDDFVGVLNVGYPLRPSAEYNNGLSGLGLSGWSSNMQPAEIKFSPLNSEDFLQSPGSFFSSPTIDEADLMVLEYFYDWHPITNSRDLFVIAEEDEDESPDFEGAHSTNEAIASNLEPEPS